MTLVLAGSVNVLNLEQLSDVLTDADWLICQESVRHNENEFMDLIRNHAPVESDEE